MKRLNTIILTIFFFLFPSLSLSASPSDLLKRADRCRKELLRSKIKRKYRINWLRCIAKYKRIYRIYPLSPEAPWAIYHCANLYLGLYRYSGKKRDLNCALTLYRWLVEKYPHHRLADDAQYKIGWIFYKYKHDLKKAYIEFLKVEIRYPHGDMKRRAKRILDHLAVLLGKSNTKILKKGLRKKKIALKNIRYWSTYNYARVVIDLERSAKYSYRLYRKNLVIYIKNAFIPRNSTFKRRIKKGPVSYVIARAYKNGIVRVILIIKEKKDYDIFHLFNPFRIVIDVGERIKIARSKKKPKITLSTKILKKKIRRGIRKTKKKDNTISLAQQLGLRIRRIVIDPGHGGRDPGCIWGGIKEKDITLRIAKLLAKKLRSMGYEVYLTRTRDTYLSLEKRIAIANMKHADLFISIHVNAHRNRRLRGIETYFLNVATDERAILVAARENATSEKNMSDLQSILSSLMLNTKIHESSRLAYDIQKEIVSTLRYRFRYRYIQDLGVKQAPFYVLIGARMPAILIEVGFITNRLERKRLLDLRYERALAYGIARGIVRYINENQSIASRTY